MWVYIVCVTIGLLSIGGAQLLLWREKRRINLIKEGIEWQYTKAQKVADGWRPSLYDDDATEAEKVDAILAYAEGRPLPVKERPQLPPGGKKRRR